MARREIDAKFDIISELNGSTFRATFADGPPVVTEGYAGWQVIARPKDVGVVEWQGRNPMAIEIPFMIDYWRSSVNSPGEHCEAMVQVLERLCGIGSHNQPPVCRVDSGGVIPHDHTIWKQGRWVIENVTWDKTIELRNPNTGNRLRCGGTIQIRQFVTAQDILRKIKPTDRARAPRVYIVKKGDTLNKIANFYYRDPTKWKVIADANKIRDRRNLKVGDRLKIPRIG